MAPPHRGAAVVVAMWRRAFAPHRAGCCALAYATSKQRRQVGRQAARTRCSGRRPSRSSSAAAAGCAESSSATRPASTRPPSCQARARMCAWVGVVHMARARGGRGAKLSEFGHRWRAKIVLPGAAAAAPWRRAARRFDPKFRDNNRRDISKSQSKWTASKMETPCSPLGRLPGRRPAAQPRALRGCDAGAQSLLGGHGAVAEQVVHTPMPWQHRLPIPKCPCSAAFKKATYRVAAGVQTAGIRW
eukprot:COSAG01_NODE_169_length_23159_cov_44.920035_14_plen_245_part_00